MSHELASERATIPAEMAFEPIEDTTEASADHKAPRMGQGGVDEKPVEAEGDNNPIHHSGHIPVSPLTK